MLLAGDIGATKTNLGLFSSESGPRSPLAESEVLSARYPSLVSLVREFLSQVDVQVKRASFGVAAPVVNGRATFTNLPWVVEETSLQEELDIPSVTLMNDLVAVAHAVPILERSDLETLNRGQPAFEGAIAVIAPGTGLGEAFLGWDGSRYRAYASEGGNADFAPTNPLEIELLRYLRDRFEHVSFEDVCSGRGLPHIYAFLKEVRDIQEPSWLAHRLCNADDPTPVIVKAAMDDKMTCELCRMALDIFVSILGAEAGNLALTVMATGGVYLGGGIPPRILAVLMKGNFMEAFRRKGSFSTMLDRVPVHVILNPKAGLFGAASSGLEL